METILIGAVAVIFVLFLLYLVADEHNTRIKSLKHTVEHLQQNKLNDAARIMRLEKNIDVCFKSLNEMTRAYNMLAEELGYEYIPEDREVVVTPAHIEKKPKVKKAKK